MVLQLAGKDVQLYFFKHETSNCGYLLSSEQVEFFDEYFSTSSIHFQQYCFAERKSRLSIIAVSGLNELIRKLKPEDYDDKMFQLQLSLEELPNTEALILPNPKELFELLETKEIELFLTGVAEISVMRGQNNYRIALKIAPEDVGENGFLNDLSHRILIQLQNDLKRGQSDKNLMSFFKEMQTALAD